MPIYLIAEQARERGFRRSGNVAIQRILSYPLYAGMQHVDAFKDYPGGLFPAQHEPIIDLSTWEMVQRKLRKPEKERVVIDEKIPLRGVLKCFCGKLLTGQERLHAGSWVITITITIISVTEPIILI